MKKVIVLVVVSFLLGVTSFAAIESVDAQLRFATALSQLKSTVKSYSDSLHVMRDRANDVVINHPAQLDEQDKAKLPDLKTKVNTAIVNLDDINNYIITNWPDLE